jgi:hypothetical protein
VPAWRPRVVCREGETRRSVPVGAALIALAQGAGPGNVSFDLQAMTKLVGGSLEVVAGDVTAVSGVGIVFRLKGKSGETVIFTFDVAP